MDNPKPLILAVYELKSRFHGYAMENMGCFTNNKQQAKEFFSASDAVAYKNKLTTFLHQFLGKNFSTQIETKD